MGQISTSNSDISRSFGADVSITKQAGGLSLVVGRGHSPEALIQGAGGRIVLALSSTKVLAYLSLATRLAFQHHPHITFAGPVELDQVRFAQFIAMFQQDRHASAQSSNQTAAPKTAAVTLEQKIIDRSFTAFL